MGVPVMSLAGVQLDLLGADFAEDLATPMEFTAALPGSGDLMCVVTSAAAEQIAPVGFTSIPHGGAIAESADGAERAHAEVALAVVGRGLEED